MKRFCENAIRAKGIMDDAVRFVIDHQLKDRKTWKLYIDVFNSRVDSADERWRGEYFGKQMRGACYAYLYTRDEELYEILTWAAEEIIKTQDVYGRISTYTADHEFCGWDMWCRKYVLTGLQHYYRICKDAGLKERILAACCKHLDYIADKIGTGKIEITSTSMWWGAVNSCTILEPTVELYKMTGCERYLDFAKYIISTGGSSDCNLIELALEGSLMPYQYPVTKAYEMMSFYEGLIAYYEVTKEQKYLDVAKRFLEAVAQSDITIIGCAGCTHELFDNSAVKQTEYSENIMQETCVTVTWIRILTRMYLLTGDPMYYERIELAGYNALYGSLNTRQCQQKELVSGKYFPAKTFDSYSPLYMNSRGRGIGGFLTFANGEYGGCCVAIGACGVSLMPMLAVVCDEASNYVNQQFSGTVTVKDKYGKDILLEFENQSPVRDACSITVPEDCDLNIQIRKPNWCKSMQVNGKTVSGAEYYDASGHYKAGEKIVYEWERVLEKHELNDKIAFTYGEIVLAADSAKSNADIRLPVSVPDKLDYTVLEPEEGELVRIECQTNDGILLLTDYQSCGKNWTQENNVISVWLNM